MIQIDFLYNESLFAIISSFKLRKLESLFFSFCSKLINSWIFLSLFSFSIKLLIAFDNSNEIFRFNNDLRLPKALLFLILLARYIPYPNSALSSNKLLAHAGPLPWLSTLYGQLGALPPYIDEQPVALAIIILFPNSWVNNLMYGVSPHPGQAPLNSK